MIKELFTTGQKVYFINGLVICTGKISSMMPTNPNYIKITKIGKVPLHDAFIDKHTALIRQNVLIEEEIKNLHERLGMNVRSLGDFWDVN